MLIEDRYRIEVSQVDCEVADKEAPNIPQPFGLLVVELLHSVRIFRMRSTCSSEVRIGSLALRRA